MEKEEEKIESKMKKAKGLTLPRLIIDLVSLWLSIQDYPLLGVDFIYTYKSIKLS